MRKYIDNVLLWMIGHLMYILSREALEALVYTIVTSQATVVHSMDELMEVLDIDEEDKPTKPKLLN